MYAHVTKEEGRKKENKKKNLTAVTWNAILLNDLEAVSAGRERVCDVRRRSGHNDPTSQYLPMLSEGAANPT